MRARSTRRARSRRTPPRRCRGAALVVTLLLVALGLGVGLTGAMTSKTDLRIANNTKLRLQALAAAEAGALHAVHLLRADGGASFRPELADGTGGRLVPIGAAATLDGAGPRYRTATLGAASYHVRLVDNVDEATDIRTVDRDRHAIVRALGRAGTAERAIEAMVRAGASGMGVFGRDGIDIGGGSAVDSYDASRGAYDAASAGAAASVGSNGDIKLNNDSVTIAGDVSAAGSLLGGGSISGTTTVGGPPRSLPAQPPCGGPWSDGSGIGGGSYSGPADGELSASSGDVVTFDAGVYCLHSISLSGSATLVVGSAPVDIYLTGKADLTGGGVVNGAGAPGALNFYSSGSEIKIRGGSAAAMSVYAPDAKVSISGGSHFFGTVVGAEVTVSGGTLIHVDESLTGSGEFEVVGWHEVGG